MADDPALSNGLAESRHYLISCDTEHDSRCLSSAETGFQRDTFWTGSSGLQMEKPFERQTFHKFWRLQKVEGGWRVWHKRTGFVLSAVGALSGRVDEGPSLWLDYDAALKPGGKLFADYSETAKYGVWLVEPSPGRSGFFTIRSQAQPTLYVRRADSPGLDTLSPDHRSDFEWRFETWAEVLKRNPDRKEQPQAILMETPDPSSPSFSKSREVQALELASKIAEGASRLVGKAGPEAAPAAGVLSGLCSVLGAMAGLLRENGFAILYRALVSAFRDIIEEKLVEAVVQQTAAAAMGRARGLSELGQDIAAAMKGTGDKKWIEHGERTTLLSAILEMSNDLRASLSVLSQGWNDTSGKFDRRAALAPYLVIGSYHLQLLGLRALLLTGIPVDSYAEGWKARDVDAQAAYSLLSKEAESHAAEANLLLEPILAYRKSQLVDGVGFHKGLGADKGMQVDFVRGVEYNPTRGPVKADYLKHVETTIKADVGDFDQVLGQWKKIEDTAKGKIPKLNAAGSS